MKHWIYSIKHVSSGKEYIGKTANVERRWREHKRFVGQSIIHHALKKYGIDAFEFCVVEECTDADAGDRERFHITTRDSLVPNGYNLKSGGEGGNHHETSRAKMSRSHKGKIVSAVTRERMRQARLGSLNPFFGKLSGGAKPVCLLDHTGKVLETFASARLAARHVQPDADLKRIISIASQINHCVNGKYIWAYSRYWKRPSASPAA